MEFENLCLVTILKIFQQLYLFKVAYFILSHTFVTIYTISHNLLSIFTLQHHLLFFFSDYIFFLNVLFLLQIFPLFYFLYVFFLKVQQVPFKVLKIFLHSYLLLVMMAASLFKDLRALIFQSVMPDSQAQQITSLYLL